MMPPASAVTSLVIVPATFNAPPDDTVTSCTTPPDNTSSVPPSVTTKPLDVTPGATCATAPDPTVVCVPELVTIPPGAGCDPAHRGSAEHFQCAATEHRIAATSATLTVTDGANTASIILLGNYMGSTFTASDGGFGGTSIVDVPATSALHASTAQTHKG